MLLQLWIAPLWVVYMFVCVFVGAHCARLHRLWIKSSKRLRYKPDDLASLVEGQCGYGPFCLPHMETMWAVINEWPCQMGSHWKVHMLHRWPCQLGLRASPTVNTTMRQGSTPPGTAQTLDWHAYFWQFEDVQKSMKESERDGPKLVFVRCATGYNTMINRCSKTIQSWAALPLHRKYTAK